MAPRMRVGAVARAVASRARASSSRRAPELQMHERQAQNARLQFQIEVHEQLAKQDVRISKVSGKVGGLGEKINKESTLHKAQQAKFRETIRVAADDVRFGFIKGAIQVFGVTAASLSLAFNVTRLMPRIKGMAGAKDNSGHEKGR